MGGDNQILVFKDPCTHPIYDANDRGLPTPYIGNLVEPWDEVGTTKHNRERFEKVFKNLPALLFKTLLSIEYGNWPVTFWFKLATKCFGMTAKKYEFIAQAKKQHISWDRWGILFIIVLVQIRGLFF